MSTELELVQQPLSAMEVRAQVNLIQEVMQAVMKEGTHFGTQPGAKKPSLWKPGAEKLASTFRIAVEPEIEELSHGDEYRVRIKARLTEMGSGRFLGCGVGECSSSESKYMWRVAVCQEEFDATEPSCRRVKWAKDRDSGWKPYSVQQVRMNVADVANTVLKMAKKRAMVDGILTTTGASDIFTQDIEDLPEEYLSQRQERKPGPSGREPEGNTGTQTTTGSTTGGSGAATSAISHPTEPDIRPRSQKGAQTPTQAPQAAPEPSVGQQQAVQGEVVGTEPVITEKQRKMFFAISRSCNLSDDQVKAALAGIGIHCHRDSIPKARFQDALNAIDPQQKFHTNK